MQYCFLKKKTDIHRSYVVKNWPSSILLKKYIVFIYFKKDKKKTKKKIKLNKKWKNNVAL